MTMAAGKPFEIVVGRTGSLGRPADGRSERWRSTTAITVKTRSGQSSDQFVPAASRDPQDAHNRLDDRARPVRRRGRSPGRWPEDLQDRRDGGRSGAGWRPLLRRRLQVPAHGRQPGPRQARSWRSRLPGSRLPVHGSRFDVCTGEVLDWAPNLGSVRLPGFARRLLTMGRPPARVKAHAVEQDGGKLYLVR